MTPLTVTDDPVTLDVARAVRGIRRRSDAARAYVATWEPAALPVEERPVVDDLRKLVRSAADDRRAS